MSVISSFTASWNSSCQTLQGVLHCLPSDHWDTQCKHNGDQGMCAAYVCFLICLICNYTMVIYIYIYSSHLDLLWFHLQSTETTFFMGHSILWTLSSCYHTDLLSAHVVSFPWSDVAFVDVLWLWLGCVSCKYNKRLQLSSCELMIADISHFLPQVLKGHHGSQRSLLAGLRPSFPQNKRQRGIHQPLSAGKGPALSTSGPQREGQALGPSWCPLQCSFPSAYTWLLSIQQSAVSVWVWTRAPKTSVQVCTVTSDPNWLLSWSYYLGIISVFVNAM